MTAQIISAIAYRASNKVLDLADCIIAAQIATYHKNSSLAKLYLATQNHADFPPAIFNRVYTELITLDDGKIKIV